MDFRRQWKIHNFFRVECGAVLHWSNQKKGKSIQKAFQVYGKQKHKPVQKSSSKNDDQVWRYKLNNIKIVWENTQDYNEINETPNLLTNPLTNGVRHNWSSWRFYIEGSYFESNNIKIIAWSSKTTEFK